MRTTMRTNKIAILAAVGLIVANWPAWSQEIPNVNVDPVCRGIAQQSGNPSEKGGPDLAFSQCVESEQAMRQKLVNEWSTFIPSERTACIGSETSALLPSYTDLVTCLEMAKAARALNTPSK